MATLGKIPTEMFSQLNDELQGVYLKFSYSALPVKHLEIDNREIRRKVKKKKRIDWPLLRIPPRAFWQCLVVPHSPARPAWLAEPFSTAPAVMFFLLENR